MRRQHGSPAIRVAVAAPFPEMVRLHDSTAEYADELEVCAMISSADAVLEQVRLLQPDVLLLSEELGADHHDTLARLGALAPSTRLVMLVGGAPGAAAVIADGVVGLGAPPAELRAAIVAASGRGAASQAPPAHSRPPPLHAPAPTLGPAPPAWLRVAPGADVASVPAAAADPAGPPVAPADSAPTAHRRGRPGGEPARTVLVFSGKGGVGKSIVATNLATLLAVRGARVALVDLNLQYGDVGVLLHLEAHPLSIDALARGGEDVDAVALDEALATSAHGVRVLLAPASPEASDLVTAAGLAAILDQLSATHDYVVVDSPPHLEERVVGVMEVADQILLVSSFGITSVKDTKVTLRLLQALGVDRDRVALVLNQTHPRISFPAEDIERTLRFPILSSLPYEPRMDESVDRGRPLVVTEPHSGFGRQLALIVELVGRAGGAGPTTRVRRHAPRWRLRFGR